jgi:hypothetical protein
MSEPWLISVQDSGDTCYSKMNIGLWSPQKVEFNQMIFEDYWLSTVCPSIVKV